MAEETPRNGVFVLVSISRSRVLSFNLFGEPLDIDVSMGVRFHCHNLTGIYLKLLIRAYTRPAEFSDNRNIKVKELGIARMRSRRLSKVAKHHLW